MRLPLLGSGMGEAVLWGLAALLARLPFGTRLPYHWDSVQFVMAMERFDVRVHQPHPPGYLLYVAMGRALVPLAGDGHRALVGLSLLFSALGAAALFRLADEMLGRRAARTAALLFLTGPLFWFFGEVALTYIVDFALVVVVALYAARLFRGEATWGNILGMSVTLGLAGGVRATTLPFLAPLCLLAALPSVRTAPGRLAAGAAMAGLLTVGWLLPTVWASGGLSGYRAATAAQQEFIALTAVWRAGPAALLGGVATHVGCLVNALGVALLPLAVGAYLRWRRPCPEAPRPSRTGLFLVTWGMPSALFYLLVHFGSAGYALTYLGAVLLAAALGLEALWQRLRPAAVAAVMAAVAACNMGVFLGGAPFQQETTGFGVLTVRELRDHEEYWRRLTGFVRARYRPGEVAILVPPSFTDGLRVAEFMLPEYWPATGLAVDGEKLRAMPARLKPEYFRYVTPEETRRDRRPTLCVTRVPEQTRYFRGLFGATYRERPLGGGDAAGEVRGPGDYVSVSPSSPSGTLLPSRSSSPPRPAARATLATSASSRSVSAS